jgi:hypothetical protein
MAALNNISPEVLQGGSLEVVHTAPDTRQWWLSAAVHCFMLYGSPWSTWATA